MNQLLPHVLRFLIRDDISDKHDASAAQGFDCRRRGKVVCEVVECNLRDAGLKSVMQTDTEDRQYEPRRCARVDTERLIQSKQNDEQSIAAGVRG